MMAAAVDTLSAHRRDEYLQAARIAVEPEQVNISLDLTPGIDVADAVMADIDQDGDAALSESEKDGYAARVAGGLTLDVDGQPLRVDTVEVTFPGITAFRRGEGTIQLQVRARLPRLSSGRHYLRFRNDERRATSVYLANALVPESDRVSVTGQRRTPSQSELTIDFTLEPGGKATAHMAPDYTRRRGGLGAAARPPLGLEGSSPKGACCVRNHVNGASTQPTTARLEMSASG